MAYNGGMHSTSEDASGNMWSAGSHGGSRMAHQSGSNDDQDGQRGSGSYRGSFGNYNSSRNGRYGFRRQPNDRGQVETLTDAIFIQNLPKNITRDEILDIFSTVGPIKIDERSGGPKIWIYKDRDTGESNGRATVTYEDDDTANRAIAKFNDQQIDSIGAVVHVQLAQRRNNPNNNNNSRGGRGGYRGGRSHWSSDNNSRPSYNSSGNRWNDSGRGFSDDRNSGSQGGFRSMGGGNNAFSNDDDQGNSYRGSRNGSYRGASRGNGGSSNYTPY